MPKIFKKMKTKVRKMYNNFPREKDVRNALVNYLNEEKNRQAILHKSKITDSQMTQFINGKGGMQYNDFLRIIIAMDFKIINNKGELIYGNPETIAQELKDNERETFLIETTG